MADRIPYVDLARLHEPLRDELLAAVDRVLSHGQFILGREVEELEAALAERLGVHGVVGVNSGTDALILALRLLGIGPGDEVITVSHSFVATATAIRLLGALPVFVDVDDETMLLDPDLLEAAITSRTRAVVPVHLNGFPCDMAPIAEICSRRGLAIVEDCAQAFGVLYRGEPVGRRGIGAFSLHPLKTLSGCGDGGFLTVDSEEHLRELRQMRNIGLVDRDHCRLVSGNSRLDAIQAALAGVKLRHFDRWVGVRRTHAAAYREALAGRLRLPPEEPDGTRAIYSAFVVRHAARDQLQADLAARGVDARPHYPLAIHQQEAFADLAIPPLPITERVVSRILSLPCGPELTEAGRERVVSAVLASVAELA